MYGYNSLLLSLYLNFHSSQCSDAVCEALYADLSKYLGRVLAPQPLVIPDEELEILEYFCSNENVGCDRLEELRNERK